MKTTRDIKPGTFVRFKTVKDYGKIGIVSHKDPGLKGFRWHDYWVWNLEKNKLVFVGRKFLGILRKHEIQKFMREQTEQLCEKCGGEVHPNMACEEFGEKK